MRIAAGGRFIDARDVAGERRVVLSAADALGRFGKAIDGDGVAVDVHQLTFGLQYDGFFWSGITSHDIAVHALRIRVASVLGQIIPGVPVWRLGPESRWPGLPLVVFPGNVGDENALTRSVRLLTYARALPFGAERKR